jgi:hypothetical protein
MDVGTVTESGFDIKDVEEDDQILVKTDDGGVLKTRWIYRNSDGKIIIHERVEDHPEIAQAGSYLEIGLSGYASASLSEMYDNKKVAKLCADIVWSDVATGSSPFFSKTITIDGESYLAALAPVRLI